MCMYAYSCAKANGTHLGICANGFIYGSCCKIDDVVPFHNEEDTNEIPHNIGELQSIGQKPQATTPLPSTESPTSTSGIALFSINIIHNIYLLIEWCNWFWHEKFGFHRSSRVWFYIFYLFPWSYYDPASQSHKLHYGKCYWGFYYNYQFKRYNDSN